MSDYSKGFIYILKKKDDDDNENIYVGSSIDYNRRRGEHKNRCHNPNSNRYNCKAYQYIRENGGFSEWDMIIVEDYPCNNDKELKMREDEVMREVESKLNEKKVFNTDEEIKESNIKRGSKYRENHKEKMLERYKKSYYDNREKMLEKNRKYYEINKEKAKEYSRNYSKNHKEKKAEERKEKVICDKCGCEVCRGSLTRHKNGRRCVKK
jgi:alpha-galactosidase/6-phospho-beta-glucosidase family protein